MNGTMSMNELLNLLNEDIDVYEVKNWFEICQLAQQHNVHILLYKLVKDALPEDHYCPRLFQLQAKRSLESNLLLISLSKTVNSLFLRNGLTPVFLKGMDLLLKGIAKIDERPLADIDLLIAPENWLNAIDVLKSNGYVIDKHYIDQYPQEFIKKYGSNLPLQYKNAEVEIIRDPLTMNAFRKLTKWDFNTWKPNLVKINNQGSEYTLPGETESIIYIINHMLLDHNQLRLIWLRDIHLSIEMNKSFSFENLVKTANKYKFAKLVYIALFFSKKYFKTRIDEEMLKNLEIKIDSSFLDFIQKILLNNVTTNMTDVRHRSYKYMLNNRKDLLLFSLYHFFPCFDYMKKRYGIKSYQVPVRYLKRIFSVLKRKETAEKKTLKEKGKVTAVITNQIEGHASK
ncbi:MAG: nucleotidyltransferase family protein [Candidatus Coatesbacteria bacterium]|nr:nucleotidyltransferase family protein [Candidatus Coatesbacteria bacterium]